MSIPKQRTKAGGRKKGTPNKKTEEIAEIFASQNFNPAEGMAYCFNEAIKLYKHRKERRSGYGASNALGVAAKIANDAAQYVYPKRKAIEHTGKDGEKLMTTLADFIGALDDDTGGETK
jgi:hypothetical protein